MFINRILWGIALLLTASAALAHTPYEVQRRAMVQLIEDKVALSSQDIERTALDPRVLEVMARVPRHAFVPDSIRSHAYENRPLPIGYGQTISQPYIVALMTELLRVSPSDRVLEVGTGSGYQAAILAELVDAVFTLEIVEPLGNKARELLRRLGYANVTVRVGDGYYGWEEQGPFDAIVVTAAASHIPPPLVKQLKPGGRILIPVGSRFTVQQLVLVQKNIAGEVIIRQVLPVRFVPLTGGH